MVINFKHWELVKDSSFVAARAFVDSGISYQPGDPIPNFGKNMRALYETKRITIAPPGQEPQKKARKVKQVA